MRIGSLLETSLKRSDPVAKQIHVALGEAQAEGTVELAKRQDRPFLEFSLSDMGEGSSWALGSRSESWYVKLVLGEIRQGIRNGS